MRYFQRTLPLCLTLLWLPFSAVAQTCDENTECSAWKDCKQWQVSRIPYEKIKKCMQEGYDAPVEWLRQGGRGAANTGGTGSLIKGGLNNPFMPGSQGDDPSASSGGASSSSGASGGGLPSFSFPPGPAAGNSPDCRSYKSPRLLESCDILGERQSLSSNPRYGCGYAVKLDQHWASFTPNATHVAMTVPRDSELKIYRKGGSNLNYNKSTPLPKFYCLLDEDPNAGYTYSSGSSGTVDDPGGSTGTAMPIRFARKVPITPNQHSFEFNDRTKNIIITMKHAQGAVAGQDSMGDGFLILTREGGSFVPPEPNPEFFTAQGAVDVDPECYSLGQLLSPTVPDGFGEIMFGNHRNDSCDTGSIYPHTFMEDGEQCAPFVQYYNSYNDAFYVPPDANASIGRVNGGDPYSETTIRASMGQFKTDPETGTVYYDGPMVYASNLRVILGTGSDGVNQQAFPGGVTFTINRNRQLRVNPPGRIKLYNDYHMQLTDGGEIEDSTGRVIRRMRPNSNVQFPTGKPVQGFVNGSIAANADMLMPTNRQNQRVLPYDSRLNYVCEAE